MKYLFTLFLLLSFVFFSCEADEPTPARLLRGTWQNVSLESEYYDNAGTKVFREKQVEPGSIFIHNNQIIYSFTNGIGNDFVDYTLVTSPNGSLINTSGRNGLKTEIQVTRLDKSNMTWVIENNKMVNYIENGTTKTAQKLKQTYKYER